VRTAGAQATSPPRHHAARTILPGELEHMRRAVVGDARCGELGGTDLEADELAFGLARTTPRVLSVGSLRSRGRLVRPLRPLQEIRELDFLLQIHVHLSAAKRRPSVGRTGSAVKSM